VIKILSLGAGVQSTTVLLMSVLGELDRLDHAIFADTGWEPAAVYKHLEWLEEYTREHAPDIKLHRVSIGRTVKEDALEATRRGDGEGARFANMPLYTTNRETGEPGIVRRQCTREFKVDPIEKYIRGFVKPPRRKKGEDPEPLVEQWFGISLDEIQRMRMSDKWWKYFHYPLVEERMTRDDCLQWMMRRGFPEPPRSACIACPFKSNMEWRRLRDESPEEWEEACEFDEQIRVRGGMYSDLFVHRDRVPLREADLSTPEDHGQLNLWDNECAGMCGV